MQLELELSDPCAFGVGLSLAPGWRRLWRDGGCDAIDPDGLRWVAIDGQWCLYVPWFRSTGADVDDVAVCVDEWGGDVPLPISPDGIITAPDGRQIPPRLWYH